MSRRGDIMKNSIVALLAALSAAVVISGLVISASTSPLGDQSAQPISTQSNPAPRLTKRPELAPVSETRETNRIGGALKSVTRSPASRAQLAPLATQYIIAEYDFEDGLGGPDTQGWTSADATAQADTFFHIDDFSGLTGYAPLAGSQSLWCGARAEDSLCHYATLPGYGNNWAQDFESVAFVSSGDVTLDFLIRYDCEPDYDFVYVQYLSQSGIWQTLLSFTGEGSESAGAVIPADSISGSVKIRFRFISDILYSDEDGVYSSDGAVVLDNITVADTLMVLDTQDFESESSGAQTTADGDWTAKTKEPFGDYAALFDGSTVVQEDSLVTNDSHLWGFFSGSTDNYSCGGFPLQPAVPFTRNPGSTLSADYLSNEIRSPWIDLTHDKDGLPVPEGSFISLLFDVYRDMPSDNAVVYRFLVRSKRDFCPAGPWRASYYVYNGGQKDWYRFSKDLTTLIEPSAQEFQVALRAQDVCWSWCGGEISGTCHSHAPLFDNVAVVATVGADTFVVTNTNDTGAGSLRQAIRDANMSVNWSHITFDIPGAVPHVIQPSSYALPTLEYTTEIDGTTQPGYVDTPVIGIDGSLVAGSGIWINYDAENSLVRGLEVFNCNGSGIVIYSSGVNIESSHIWGNASWGIVISGNSNTIGGWAGGLARGNIISGNALDGVSVSGNNNTIGGVHNGAGNTISDNDRGVVVEYGTGNAIRWNAIWGNNGLGIDLNGDGVTYNDALDADGGPNGLQNYPVLMDADPSTGQIQGMIDSKPSQSYRIDLFANSLSGSGACDPSGHGEGERFLGSTTVSTDSFGHSSFSVTVSEPFEWEESLTATATDASLNTSEFSACFPLTDAILVLNRNDSGPGSLRQAILDANAAPDTSVIAFSIDGAGPHTIQPLTQLPTITIPVIIDGYTQRGASANTNGDGLGGNAVLRIVLDGSTLSDSTANGLYIRADHCTVRGLVVNGFPWCGIRAYSTGNVIEGNYVGTDVTGTLAQPNEVGIAVLGDSNIVGGAEPAARNVVSGNASHGIYMQKPRWCLVQGNFVGVSTSGASGVANGGSGVYVDLGNDNVIDRNVISVNTSTGVSVVASVNDDQYGIGNTIRRNYIGTDVTGTVALGNGSDGVFISVVALSGEDNTVGGSTDNGNLIANNGRHGVFISLPNGGLRATVSYNTIHSNAKGIVSKVGYSTISRNIILSNSDLGIDLGDNGVTPNDLGDPDTGANELQNFPVLMAFDAESLTVTGTLNSRKGAEFDLEFFSSASCDPSGYGEGATYRGGARVTTDKNGNAEFEVELSTPIPGGHYITATARPVIIDGGTSEFSACFEVINTPSGTNVSTTPVDEATGETPVALTFDEVTVAGNTLLEISGTGPAVPGTFIVGDSAMYYHLSTTATFNDSILVCFSYDEAKMPGAEEDLVILHYDTTLIPPDWVDITVSVDTLSNVVCGRSATLSPFVLAVPATTTDTDLMPGAPTTFALYQNIPNPFNPVTTIRFDLPVRSHVRLAVYNVKGQLIRVLLDEQLEAGRTEVMWDGRDAAGRGVASGIYFCHLQAAAFNESRKMILLR
jgi:hypothetical protein